MTLFQKIKWYLTQRTKVPDCFEDNDFMYCWCGKCVQDEYKLPEDVKKILAIKIVENYKNKDTSSH